MEFAVSQTNIKGVNVEGKRKNNGIIEKDS
jgi:hypothetical protein